MTEKQFLVKLDIRIKQLRTDQDLSQNAFGNEIEMEKSNVSRLESGKVNPRVATLLKVAKALQIRLSDLLDLE